MLKKPRLNRDLKEQLGKQLPLAFARPEDPVIGATLTAVRLADGEATIDEGLLHGRSEVERGIRWTLARPEDAPPGSRTYHIAWVAMRGGEGNLAYHGVTVSKIVVHRESRQGWKSLTQEVNAMDEAAKGRVDVRDLPEDLYEALRRLLDEKGHGAWQRSPEAFREAFRNRFGDVR
jgi:hypothetical protein